MDIFLRPLISLLVIGPTIVFAILVIGIFFSTEQVSGGQLALLAGLLGAVMAWADAGFQFFYRYPEDGFAGTFRAFLVVLLIYEPFPIVAAIFRRSSLAARDRGDPDAAENINGAGLTIVILGLLCLAGVIVWRSNL